MNDFFNRLFRNFFRRGWVTNFQFTLSSPCTGDFFVSFHASLNNFLFAKWKCIVFNDFSCVWQLDVFFFRYGTFDTTVNDLGAHVFGNMLRCRNWISYFLTFLSLVGGQDFFFTNHSFNGDFFFPFHHGFIFDDFSSKWNWFFLRFCHGTTDTYVNNFIHRLLNDVFSGSCFGRSCWLLWYSFKCIHYFSFSFTYHQQPRNITGNRIVLESEGVCEGVRPFWMVHVFLEIASFGIKAFTIWAFQAILEKFHCFSAERACNDNLMLIRIICHWNTRIWWNNFPITGWIIVKCHGLCVSPITIVFSG